MKAIYPFVGGTASTHKWNLKDPRDLDAAFRLVFNGGWTHSSTGALPNGTNGFADTKLNLLSNYGTTFNNHFSVYYRTAGQFAEKIGAYGSFYENGMSAHIQQNGTLYYNDNMGRTIINSTSSAIAYHISSLLSTSSNAQKFYRNNAILGSGTANILSTYPSLNFYFGGANNNGTPSQYSNRQAAFASIGDGLTDTEAANLYTRVQAYQTALSRNV
jgi:hypothetical protein